MSCSKNLRLPGSGVDILVGSKGKDCEVNEVIQIITESMSVHQIQIQWRDLARRLNIRETIVKEMERKVSNSGYMITDVLSELLLQWCGAKSKDATLNVLIISLELLDFNDAASDLKMKFLPESEYIRSTSEFSRAVIQAREDDNNVNGAFNADDENQPLRRESLTSQNRKLTKRQTLICITTFLLIAGAATVLLILTLPKHGSPTPPPATTTTTTGVDTSSLSKITSSTPEVTTVTPERTTKPPVCPYTDWSWPTCPEGDGWASWSSKTDRDEICSRRGWNYGWAVLLRRGIKEDCFCCSDKNCIYP